MWDNIDERDQQYEFTDNSNYDGVDCPAKGGKGHLACNLYAEQEHTSHIDSYINDSTEPLCDDFCPETPVGDFGPYEVPEGCYFMLGDNRNVSKDSRYWLNPYVEKDKIIGKAFLRYWPLNKISLIE